MAAATKPAKIIFFVIVSESKLKSATRYTVAQNAAITASPDMRIVLNNFATISAATKGAALLCTIGLLNHSSETFSHSCKT